MIILAAGLLDGAAPPTQENETALKMAPNRMGALYGAARAAEAAKESKKAQGYYKKVLAQAKRAQAGRAELVAAKAFLTKAHSR